MARLILFVVVLSALIWLGRASYGYFEMGRDKLKRSAKFQPLKWIAVGVFIWLVAALVSMVSTTVGLGVFMAGTAVMALSLIAYAFVVLVGFLTD